ncbi:hypothetical protein ABIA44_000865 [Bradyrhizobium sp. USDA 329]
MISSSAKKRAPRFSAIISPAMTSSPPTAIASSCGVVMAVAVSTCVA